MAAAETKNGNDEFQPALDAVKPAGPRGHRHGASDCGRRQGRRQGRRLVVGGVARADAPYVRRLTGAGPPG